MLHWFARRLKEAQEKDKTGQGGFTLIELLVVVIIIGILAAIAIPTFLAQRSRAQDAGAVSDLRNAATLAETYSTTQNGSYAGLNSTVLTGAPYNHQPTQGTTGFAAGGNATNFEIVVTSQSGATCRYVKNAAVQVGCSGQAPATVMATT